MKLFRFIITLILLPPFILAGGVETQLGNWTHYIDSWRAFDTPLQMLTAIITGIAIGLAIVLVGNLWLHVMAIDNQESDSE